jgi:hypothetical protein
MEGEECRNEEGIVLGTLPPTAVASDERQYHSETVERPLVLKGPSQERKRATVLPSREVLQMIDQRVLTLMGFSH